MEMIDRRKAELLAKLHELGITQTDLAKESGVCLSYLNRGIRGRLKLKPYQQEKIIGAINKRLAPWSQLSVSDYFDEAV
jgi:predicted transcriptional regulator